MTCSSTSVSVLYERVSDLITAQKLRNPSRRILIALAGVPGSGKSTIAAALLKTLHDHGIDDTAVLPMDGFHYPRDTLALFDDPAMAFRKRGAPFTFDVEKLLSFIISLRNTPVTMAEEPETIIHAPGFDHAEQDPVPDAIAISSQCRLVIIEGNYTLLNVRPWNEIASLVDERWFVNVSPRVALDRLVKRHIHAGIEPTVEAAIARAQDNDIPNGELIRNLLLDPDVII